MIPLLVITGLLLVVSGGVKVRAGTRAGLGAPILSLLEMVAGVGLCVVAFARPPSAGEGLRFVYGAVGLLLVSSVLMGRRLSALRKERDDSEPGRLVKYVKYLSRGGSE